MPSPTSLTTSAARFRSSTALKCFQRGTTTARRAESPLIENRMGACCRDWFDAEPPPSSYTGAIMNDLLNFNDLLQFIKANWAPVVAGGCCCPSF